MNEQIESNVQDELPLEVKTVLVGSLPRGLQTDQAPMLYTVEAVFSRKVKTAEIDRIASDSTKEHLASRGYPQVRLEVGDRRLRIHHTTLEELRDGLAAVIAETLATISIEVVRAERLAALAAELSDERELQRAKAVLALAESVDFSLPADFTTENLATQELARDAAQISDWDEEGGRGGQYPRAL